MGHTRAVLTLRLPSGCLLYVNTELAATEYFDRMLKCDYSYAAQHTPSLDARIATAAASIEAHSSINSILQAPNHCLGTATAAAAAAGVINKGEVCALASRRKKPNAAKHSWPVAQTFVPVTEFLTNASEVNVPDGVREMNIEMAWSAKVKEWEVKEKEWQETRNELEAKARHLDSQVLALESELRMYQQKEEGSEKNASRNRAVDVSDASCSASAAVIDRETARTRPEGSFRAEWDARVKRHQDLYPGGTLPSELRSWEDYWQRLKRTLNSEETESARCQFCGKVA